MPVGAWPVYILLESLVLVAAVLAEINPLHLFKRSRIVFPFVLAAFPLIFTLPGEPLTRFQIGDTIIHLSQPGLYRFLSISLKSWISIQAAILLTITTSFPGILMALRSMHVPRIFVEIISLMWRYLFIIGEEARRMLNARASRSGQAPDNLQKPGGSVLWRAKVTGGMAGSLFLRSMERSERVYQAMLARGYEGELRSLPVPPISRSDWIILAIGSLSISALLIFGMLYW